METRNGKRYIISDGRRPRQLLDELSGLLVRVAMKQTVADFEGDDLYAPELLERLAKALAPEDIQLFYQTAITGRRDLARRRRESSHVLRELR